MNVSSKTLRVSSVEVANFDDPWTELGFDEPNMGISEGKFPWTLLEAKATVAALIVDNVRGIALEPGTVLTIRYYPEAQPRMFGVFDWRAENPVRNPTSEYVPPYIGASIDGANPRVAILFTEKEKSAIAGVIEKYLGRSGDSGTEFIARWNG